MEPRPVNPPPDAIPPELRNHADYEVLRELGRGGMGVVFLAKNRRLDRLEVLKVVNPHLLDHPTAAERFLREMRSAARLSHPNIATTYAAPQAGQLLLFAMEYVDGEDLARVVAARGPLPVANACHYVQQAALGLQHAFEKGMIHRDIKPQNLILALDGNKHVVKILDFGLAKVTREKEADRKLTKTGGMLGTPDFIAPEQIQDAAAADIRADVYSLGCTLYFLLTGHPPFDAPNLYALFYAHQNLEATPLNEVRKDVPTKLAAVVSKMMAKQPVSNDSTTQAPALPKDTTKEVAATEKETKPVEVPPLVTKKADPPPKPPPFVTAKADPPPKPPVPGEVVEVEIAKGVKMKFCWVPAGEAQLGAPKGESGASPEEAEEVRGKFKTKGFWLGKYVVTQEEWVAVMGGENQSRFAPSEDAVKKAGITDTGRFPVENVSWDDCQDFLKKLNTWAKAPVFMGKGKFALPHEDQWEYACRGGRGNKRPFYFGNSLNGDLATCDGTFPYGTDVKGEHKKRTTEVGYYEYRALHPWGLCDMHGNVWQWCDNLDEKDKDLRVMRGGSWGDGPVNCRAANRRCRVVPSYRNDDCGCRVIFRLD